MVLKIEKWKRDNTTGIQDIEQSRRWNGTERITEKTVKAFKQRWKMVTKKEEIREEIEEALQATIKQKKQEREEENRKKQEERKNKKRKAQKPATRKNKKQKATKPKLRKRRSCTEEEDVRGKLKRLRGGGESKVNNKRMIQTTKQLFRPNKQLKQTPLLQQAGGVPRNKVPWGGE